MTWLAPWALAAGALGMLGVIAAHLLSRQRPRALALATARFLPTGMLEATTLQRVPTDRWWMLLRLLILALLALGVTQPVATISRVPTRTVLLLDGTLPLPAQQRAIDALGESDAVIAFDTVAVIKARDGVRARLARSASLSAAFALLAHARDSLASRTTQLRVTIASSFASRSFDPATRSLRELLPDSITALPIELPDDSAVARGAIVVHAVGDDPIAATALLLGDSVARVGTIIERGDVLTLADSSAAESGATVLWWPTRSAKVVPALQALTVASTTWIAPMTRDSSATPLAGRVVGWWADGSAAVREHRMGDGCVLSLSAGLPEAGDHSLSLAAQAWLAAVLTSCDREPNAVHAAPAWLAAPPSRRLSFAKRPVIASLATPWLIGAALGLALLELLLRRRFAS